MKDRTAKMFVYRNKIPVCVSTLIYPFNELEN